MAILKFNLKAISCVLTSVILHSVPNNALASYVETSPYSETSPIRKTVCASIPDEEACSVAIEKHELEYHDGGFRDGNLLALKLLNGTYKKLVNVESDGDGVAHYLFFGATKFGWLVQFSMYEGGGYYLIDRDTGEITNQIPGIPIVSPGEARFATSGTCDDTCGLLSIYKNTLKGYVLEWQASGDIGPLTKKEDQSWCSLGFSAEDIRWIDDETLTFTPTVSENGRITKKKPVILHSQSPWQAIVK